MSAPACSIAGKSALRPNSLAAPSTASANVKRSSVFVARYASFKRRTRYKNMQQASSRSM